MSRNEQLYQAFEAWLQAALLILGTKPLPVYQEVEVTFNAHGWQSQGGDFKPDYTHLVSMYRNDLLALTEIDSIVNIVANTPTFASALFVDFQGNSIVEFERQKQVLNRFYLDKFLLAYLNATKSLALIPTAFERVYHQLEQYVGEESFDCVCTVYLYNLYSEVDTVLLEQGISFRRMTQSEKGNTVRSMQSFTPSYSSVPDVFLEIHHPIGRTTQPDQQKAINIAQAIVLMLRLFKANPIEVASYRWTVPEQPFKWIPTPAYFPILPHPSTLLGEPYVLTQEDAAILPTLWPKTKKAYKDVTFATAITRFEDSYSRIKPEDKLIDYWIALESLFFALIPKEYVGSMGETVASTIAYYLGKTDSDRRSIFAFIISSHTARGYFVHGQRGKPVENLDLVVRKTEQYLRAALRKRIEE